MVPVPFCQNKPVIWLAAVIEVLVKDSEKMVFPDTRLPTVDDVSVIPTKAQPEPVPVEILCVERLRTVFPLIVASPTVTFIPFKVGVEEFVLPLRLATVLFVTAMEAAPEVTAIPVRDPVPVVGLVR